MTFKQLFSSIGDALDGAQDGTFDRDAAINRARELLVHAHAQAKADSRKAFCWGIGAGVLLTLLAYAAWSLA